MDLDLTGRTGLGAYHGVLGLVAKTPRHTLNTQGDVLDACQRRAAPHPAHVANIHAVNRPRTLCRLMAVQARALLV